MEYLDPINIGQGMDILAEETVGTITHFNPSKGFGFINDGSQDHFVHIADIDSPELKTALQQMSRSDFDSPGLGYILHATQVPSSSGMFRFPDDLISAMPLFRVGFTVVQTPRGTRAVRVYSTWAGSWHLGSATPKAPRPERPDLKGGLGASGGGLGSLTMPQQPAPSPINVIPAEIPRLNLNAKGHGLNQELQQSGGQLQSGVVLPLDDISLPKQERTNSFGGTPSVGSGNTPVRKPINDWKLRRILNAIYNLADGGKPFSWIVDANEVVTGIEIDDEQVPLLGLDSWAEENYGITFEVTNWLQKIGDVFRYVTEQKYIATPKRYDEFGAGYYVIESYKRDNSILLYSGGDRQAWYFIAKILTLIPWTPEGSADFQQARSMPWDEAIPTFLERASMYAGPDVMQRIGSPPRPRLALRHYLVNTNQGFAVSRYGEAASELLLNYATGDNDAYKKLLKGADVGQRTPSGAKLFEARHVGFPTTPDMVVALMESLEF